MVNEEVIAGSRASARGEVTMEWWSVLCVCGPLTTPYSLNAAIYGQDAYGLKRWFA